MTLPLFRTIVVDVPWHEPGGCGRGTKYRTVRTVAEALHVILLSPAWRPADDCHLYMWQTSTHYEEPLELVRLLGFKRVSVETWIKTSPRAEPTAIEEARHRTGTGQYFLHCAEWALLGSRGSAAIPGTKDRLHSVFYAPRGDVDDHSAKPDKFYERCARTSPGPRVDMFARQRRPGWYTWGDALGPDVCLPEAA